MYTSTYAPKPSKTFPAEQLEADAEPMKKCEAQRKESAQHWQCDSELQSMEDKPWRNEEVRNLEEGLPRPKEGSLDTQHWCGL